MRFEYFPDTDTLYIDITESTSSESREISPGVVLDYDADGNLSGIEIDNASKVANMKRFVTKSFPGDVLVGRGAAS
jgi:uncharacterized protein YuzE